MTIHSDFTQRMKEYESRNQYYLQKKIPVILRYDGKSMHTFTKHLNRPFDSVFMNTMAQTMESVSQSIQNCVFAYCQSDECSLLLLDTNNIQTAAWFEYRTDKLCSITASLATYYFNKYFKENAKRIISLNPEDNYSQVLERCTDIPALFDCRCFNLPKEEVISYFYNRQADCVRNSILSCGYAQFSHKELEKVNCKGIRQKLEEINKPWEDLPIYKQRGICCKKEEEGWVTDYCMPLLVKEGREYLEAIL